MAPDRPQQRVWCTHALESPSEGQTKKVPTKLSDGSTHVHLHMDICGSKKVIWAFDRTFSLQMYVMFFSGQLYVACNGAAITLRLPTGDRSDSASQSSTARHARERGTTDVDRRRRRSIAQSRAHSKLFRGTK